MARQKVSKVCPQCKVPTPTGMLCDTCDVHNLFAPDPPKVPLPVTAAGEREKAQGEGVRRVAFKSPARAMVTVRGVHDAAKVQPDDLVRMAAGALPELRERVTKAGAGKVVDGPKNEPLDMLAQESIATEDAWEAVDACIEATRLDEQGKNDLAAYCGRLMTEVGL